MHFNFLLFYVSFFYIQDNNLHTDVLFGASQQMFTTRIFITKFVSSHDH